MQPVCKCITYKFKIRLCIQDAEDGTFRKATKLVNKYNLKKNKQNSGRNGCNMIISHMVLFPTVERRTDLRIMKQMPATNVNRCGRGKKKELTSDAIADVHTHPQTRPRMKKTCFRVYRHSCQQNRDETWKLLRRKN